MECKRCGADNPPAKKTCMECGAILEGYTFNNVTGEFGYRGGDGEWYKSEEEYLLCSHKKLWEPSKPYQAGDCILHDGRKMICRGDNGMDEWFRMKRKFKLAKIVICVWTAICVGFCAFGLSNIITTISNVMFMAFLLWMVRSEEKRRDDEILEI